jgi:hypothetical protein
MGEGKTANDKNDTKESNQGDLLANGPAKKLTVA